MLYQFSCESCGHTDLMPRSVDDRDAPADCICGNLMHRRFTPPTSIIPPFKESYNPALGKFVNSRSELRDELKKYKDTHGSELIEVGNEKIRPKRELDYSFDEKQAAHELKSRLGG